MTRTKSRPPVRKPVFDEQAVLRFAAGEPSPAGTTERGAGADRASDRADRKGGKGDVPERESLTLTLKTEVLARLRAEAGRKEKTVDQIVEKLVTKHLGRH